MKFKNLYLARFLSKSFSMKHNDLVDIARRGEILSLESFWDRTSLEKTLLACPKVKIFLDSGAYSMLTKGVKDIKGYISSYVDFVKKYNDRFLVYANIDVIKDSEETWKRQKYLESCGLSPLPVYHFEDDFKWFEKYVNEYDYVAVGGMASGSISSKDLKFRLDKVFDYMYKKDLLSVKLHGFALFSIPFLLRYPWYSSDATTWLQHAAYGKVLIPKYDEDRLEYDYFKNPLVVRVSEQGLYREFSTKGDTHYTLEYFGNKKMRERIEQYFDMIGIDKEALKTEYHEREKVNVAFYINFVKKLRLHTATFKPRESFFI